MKKKLLSLALVLILLFALSAPAMAADTDVSSSGGTGSTSLTYTVASSYSVTIPATVALGNPDAWVNSNLAVNITNLPPNKCINAAITATDGDDNAFTVKHEYDSSKTIPYEVKFGTDGESYTSYTIGDEVGGYTEDGIIYFQYKLGTIPAYHPAGDYSGTVTFTVTLDEIDPK